MRPITSIWLLLALLAPLGSACGDDTASSAHETPDGELPDTDLSDADADTPDGDDATSDAEADSPDTEPIPWPMDDAPLPEGPWDLMAPGPYTIGFRTVEVEYVPDGMSEARSIRISIWYPSRQLDGPAPTYSGLVVRDGDGVQVFEDASVALTAPAPLLVFSMGHTGFAEQSWFMTEFFASHGWIVAAPTHTGNTIFDIGKPRPPQMFDWRPQDVRVTLDTVLGLPTDDPLSGRLSGQIMLSGHSYGGYTTMAVAGAAFDVDGILAECGRIDDEDCSYITAAQDRYRVGYADPRIGAFVPLAPGNFSAFGAEGVGAITAPVLLMTGLMDASLADATQGTPYWEALTPATAVRVQLLTGGHHTFSNSCDLVPGAFDDDGCGESFIEAAEGHRIINALAMAWARKHLFGSDAHDDLLDGTTSLHPDVEVYAR